MELNIYWIYFEAKKYGMLQYKRIYIDTKFCTYFKVKVVHNGVQ